MEVCECIVDNRPSQTEPQRPELHCKRGTTTVVRLSLIRSMELYVRHSLYIFGFILYYVIF